MAEVEQAELPEVENNAEELHESPETEEQLEAGSEHEQQEAEEFEIVLGSAEEPSAEETKKAKKPRGVKRLLAERREDKDTIAELQAKLAAQQQTAPVVNASPVESGVSMPIMPTEESTGYDPVVFQQEIVKYNQKMAEFLQSNATAAAQKVYDQQQTSIQRTRESERLTNVIESHYERAEKLNLPDYEAAEDKVIEILDQNAVSQIAQIVPNSEAVVYYLGKNPDKALELREIWENNVGAAAFKLGELSKDLKVVPKQRQRPAPESRVTGAAPATKSSLEKEIEKERQRILDGETNDMTQLNRLKGQHRQASA